MQTKWFFVQVKKRPNYEKWTESRVTEVIQLLQSLSLKDVAQRLNLSPDSISKALRRRNISVHRTRMATLNRRDESKAPKHHMAPLTRTDCSAAIRAITYLSAHRCKWPIGDIDAPNFRFCNARRITKNYCAQHDALAFDRAAA